MDENEKIIVIMYYIFLIKIAIPYLWIKNQVPVDEGKNHFYLSELWSKFSQVARKMSLLWRMEYIC